VPPPPFFEIKIQNPGGGGGTTFLGCQVAHIPFTPIQSLVNWTVDAY